jgi:hypothetical protein
MPSSQAILNYPKSSMADFNFSDDSDVNSQTESQGSTYDIRYPIVLRGTRLVGDSSGEETESQSS